AGSAPLALAAPVALVWLWVNLYPSGWVEISREAPAAGVRYLVSFSVQGQHFRVPAEMQPLGPTGIRARFEVPGPAGEGKGYLEADLREDVLPADAARPNYGPIRSLSSLWMAGQPAGLVVGLATAVLGCLALVELLRALAELVSPVWLRFLGRAGPEGG